MKKGFTLIELLAVIVIISIVALITVPILLNVIDNAKIGALRNSAYGIVDSANLYFAKNFGKEQESILFEFSDGKQISEKKLDINGKIENGKVVLNKENKILLCIDDGKNYAYKSYSDSKVTTGLGTCGEYEQENGEIEINDDNGAIIYVNNEVVKDIPENYLYSFVSKDKNNLIIKIITDYNQFDALELITTKKSTYTSFNELLNDTELFEQIMNNELAVEYLINSSELIEEIKQHESYSEELVPIILATREVTEKKKYESGLPFYLYGHNTSEFEFVGSKGCELGIYTSGSHSVTKNGISLSVVGSSNCCGGTTYGSKIDMTKYSKVISIVDSAYGTYSSCDYLIRIMDDIKYYNSTVISTIRPQLNVNNILDLSDITGEHYYGIQLATCANDDNSANGASININVSKVWFE